MYCYLEIMSIIVWIKMSKSAVSQFLLTLTRQLDNYQDSGLKWGCQCKAWRQAQAHIISKLSMSVHQHNQQCALSYLCETDILESGDQTHTQGNAIEIYCFT